MQQRRRDAAAAIKRAFRKYKRLQAAMVKLYRIRLTAATCIIRFWRMGVARWGTVV